MKWLIAAVFCGGMCWIGWRIAPGAMGTWTTVWGLPITGYMAVLVGSFALFVRAKK